MHPEHARKILRQQVEDALAESRLASAKFEQALAAVPTGFPDPDGVQYLYNTSREYAAARQKVADADGAAERLCTSRDNPFRPMRHARLRSHQGPCVSFRIAPLREG